MSKRHPAALPSHEALSRLARDDPGSFEALRSELIEDYFNGTPEPMRLRLRQLQFRIDSIRRRSGSSLGAAIKIHALMWGSFLQMNDELSEFAAQARRPSLAGSTADANTRPVRQATVLPFIRRRREPPPPG